MEELTGKNKFKDKSWLAPALACAILIFWPLVFASNYLLYRAVSLEQAEQLTRALTYYESFLLGYPKHKLVPLASYRGAQLLADPPRTGLILDARGNFTLLTPRE